MLSDIVNAQQQSFKTKSWTRVVLTYFDTTIAAWNTTTTYFVFDLNENRRAFHFEYTLNFIRKIRVYRRVSMEIKYNSDGGGTAEITCQIQKVVMAIWSYIFKPNTKKIHEKT